MVYRLLSLIEHAPAGFQYRPSLEQRDVKRWPFALLAADRETAEAALAPFGDALAGIIVTYGQQHAWHQIGQLLLHVTILHELRAHLAPLLQSYLVLLGMCQQAENSYAEQALNLLRAHEDTHRQKLEFTVIKKNLVEELAERKRVEGELVATRNQLAATLDAMPDLLFEVGLNGWIFDYHSPRTDLLIMPPEMLLNKNISDVVPPDAARICLSALREAHEKGVSTGKQYELVLPHGKFWFELSIATKAVGAGQEPRFIMLARDITDRKRHEEELLHTEKLESLGILAGGIAHDFNNILSGIMGNLSFAQQFLDAGHKSHKPLVEAETASRRASELAHQLLTFARGGEPVKKPVSVQQLVRETVSLVLHGSNVKGIVHIPDSIHAIEADEGQISQVCNNLIINARQAMPEGGMLTVTAQNERLAEDNAWSLPPGAYIRLTFSDLGCGIAEDHLKRIFDPYFTTKENGNGLGLASVHSIISRHGGHIGVSSVVGEGTTFVIRLPSTGTTYPAVQTCFDQRITGDHRGGSVLVMDDEEMIRGMATAMLEHFGYQVTTCENGTEAIREYQAARESGAPFAAVIMDLTIPGGMGGKEAAQQILAIDPKACLIVSSGYSTDPIMADYGTYGFAGAVAKPYKLAELGHQLSLCLSMRR